MKYSMYNVVWYDGVSSYVTKFILSKDAEKAKKDLLDYWLGDGEILKLDRLYDVSLENGNDEQIRTLVGIFDEYINKYKKIKMENKGAVREEAKLFLNSLYGTMFHVKHIPKKN